jgi:chromosome segregation ATPase
VEKLERAQKHAEDRRLASQSQIERLKAEYQEMANERRENDRQVEQLRAEADELERLVSMFHFVKKILLMKKIDERAYEA